MNDEQKSLLIASSEDFEQLGKALKKVAPVTGSREIIYDSEDLIVGLKHFRNMVARPNALTRSLGIRRKAMELSGRFTPEDINWWCEPA
jgi:hypothetical protein